MPNTFHKFRYNSRIDSEFSAWMKTKDDEGYEFLTIIAEHGQIPAIPISDFEGETQSVFWCIFRKKV